MSRNAHIQPTPDHTKEQDAQHAEALNNNPLFRRALDEIEEMYTEEWKRTEGPHAEYRERAYYMVRAIDKLRAHINEYASTGKLNKNRPKEVMQGK